MKTTGAKLSRRNFLFAIGAGTAAGAAAIASKKAVDGTQAQDEVIASKKGYEVTEHVRNYYRTAKI